MKKGEKIQLVGFGTFEVSKRPERQGINPATKEKITIMMITYLSLKASATLRMHLINK